MPNSVVPAAVALVAREDGAVLLIRRTHNGNWALPGGAIEMTESVAGAAVRETFEETGIQVEVTGLLGIYSDPGHVIHFTSNDEVLREFSIVLTAPPVGGEPTPSPESSDVRWVALAWEGSGKFGAASLLPFIFRFLVQGGQSAENDFPALVPEIAPFITEGVHEPKAPAALHAGIALRLQDRLVWGRVDDFDKQLVIKQAQRELNGSGTGTSHRVAGICHQLGDKQDRDIWQVTGNVHAVPEEPLGLPTCPCWRGR
jgi:8-oxo-dGTP pyrophosphatase MutT (NUDIX family)